MLILPEGISLPLLLKAAHLFNVVAMSRMTQTDTLTKASENVIHVDIDYKMYDLYAFTQHTDIAINVMNCY